MTVAEKIVELQNSLEGDTPAAVRDAINAEIKRLTRERNANDKRVYHDVHNGELRAGDVLYSYHRNPKWQDQPERFQVAVIEAVSPDGKRYATKKNYGGRPDYEEGANVWDADGHKQVGKTVAYGTWRKTKRAAWEAWAGIAGREAARKVDEARATLATREEEAAELLAYIEADHDLDAVPETKR